MKRLFLLLAAAAFLATGAKAELPSFEGLAAGLPAPSAVSPAVPAPAAAVPQAAPAAEREWLVLVFMNGVNDLGILGFVESDINEMEKIGSDDRMAVVVEYGLLGLDNFIGRNLKFPRGSKTLYVKKDNNANKVTSPVIYNSGEADMGSAAHLVRAAKRAIRQYPAKKTALILWNHGAGRLGLSFDDVSRNYIEVDQLGRALAQISRTLGRKLDVFASDACYMQMASVAYELKDSAAVIVGSEEIVPNNGYPYNVLLDGLAKGPDMDAEDLGRLIVDSYGFAYGDDATLSALRSSALQGFVDALNGWITAVKADPAALSAAADPALLRSVSRFSLPESRDLVDYIDKVGAKAPASRQVKAAGAHLKNYIAGALILRNSAKRPVSMPYTRANGLAIYIPDLRYNSANYEKLAFARESLWGAFLLELIRERLK